VTTDQDQNLTVISTYYVRADALGDFHELLRRHWPTLRDLELVSAEAPQYFAGSPGADGGVPFVEIFEWASPSAAQQAHTHPAVSAIWERMGEMWVTDGAVPPRSHLAVRALDVAH
jgi:hypothetical protein